MTAMKIPSDWLIEAGLERFVPARDCYLEEHGGSNDIIFVSLAEIKPPERDPGIQSFDRERMLRIFEAIKNDTRLPPIGLHALPVEGFKFRVANGVHRFYASLILNFQKIPASIWPHSF
jgi:ParB-like chromosome segregation protein Spo0J